MEEQKDRHLYEALGRRISDARNQRRPKMFQAGLARKLRVTRASVSNIERGEQRISIAMLYEVANILEVKLTELLPPLGDYYSTELEFAGKKLNNVSGSVKKEIQEILNEETT